MAYVSYDESWEREFDNIVSTKDKMQDVTFNQLKLKVTETYKKDEKTRTNFNSSNDEDAPNKAYADE